MTHKPRTVGEEFALRVQRYKDLCDAHTKMQQDTGLVTAMPVGEDESVLISHNICDFSIMRDLAVNPKIVLVKGALSETVNALARKNLTQIPDYQRAYNEVREGLALAEFNTLEVPKSEFRNPLVKAAFNDHLTMQAVATYLLSGHRADSHIGLATLGSWKSNDWNANWHTDEDDMYIIWHIGPQGKGAQLVAHENMGVTDAALIKMSGFADLPADYTVLELEPGDAVAFLGTNARAPSCGRRPEHRAVFHKGGTGLRLAQGYAIN